MEKARSMCLFESESYLGKILEDLRLGEGVGEVLFESASWRELGENDEVRGSLVDFGYL